MAEATIADFYVEERTFPPPEGFAGAAAARSFYDEAAADYEAFWARQARELLTWFEDFDTTLEWDLPYSRWFVGGTLNIAYNCLDRHVIAGRGDKVAFHWEGEPGDTRTISYAELLDEVRRRGSISTTEAALLVNATPATARALLDELVKVGLLEARGRTRARRYHLR